MCVCFLLSLFVDSVSLFRNVRLPHKILTRSFTLIHKHTQMDNTIKNNNNNNNAMYKNDSQRTITGHINNNYVLSSIQFSLKLGDLDQPWFHKFATRQSAIEMLTNQPVGTFIIRPSSRGCYAMSWVSETKEIKHNLIYNHFPGYSLSSPNDAVVGKKYETLTQLVENTEFLKQHIPSNQHPKRDTTKSRYSLHYSQQTTYFFVSHFLVFLSCSNSFIHSFFFDSLVHLFVD